MSALDSVVSVVNSGGWAMAPLYLCSVVGAGWTLHVVVRVQREGLGRTALLRVPIGDLGGLESQAHKDGTALGRVIAATIHALRTHPARAEEIAERAALGELDRWEGAAEVLALLARVAPLFGLLGTVLGMVELFASMEAAGATVNAGSLSGGIWKALLTTAAGLVIAIPLMGVHAWLVRRIDRLRLILEEGAGRVLDAVRGQGPR